MRFTKLSAVCLTPAEQRIRLQRLRSAEEILLSEYNTARREFDQIVQMHLTEQVKEAVERLMHSMRRLGQLLAEREVPPDVARRLDKL